MNTSDYVEHLLKNYHEIKGEVTQLKLLLKENNWETCEEEIIEELAFKRSQGERVQSSQLSDTTSRIALTYQQVMNQRNLMGGRDLEKLILINEFEIKKLEGAISILRGRYRKVIQGIYIEKIAHRDLCTKLFVSHSTLNRYRKKGIEGIEGFFRLTKL